MITIFKMQFKVLFTLFFILKHNANGVPIETDTNLDRYFQPFIIGGQDAPIGYAPYMAAILIGDDFIMVTCGGSIILPNLILTAAHCIDVYRVPGGGLMRTFHAVVGSNNFRSGGTTVQFEGYHIHPEWDVSNVKNDVGLLILKKNVQLGKTVQLVALNFDWIGAKEPSFITGWGLVTTRPSITPFQLQILEVNTLDAKRCVDIVREASILWWPDAPTVDPALEICTLNIYGITGLCYGDSGSPLMSRTTGKQIGLASWAFACAMGVPDMHARLSAYQEFIKFYMRHYQ